MAITRQGGLGIPLDTRPLIGNSNQIALAAGEFQILPAGQFYVNPGLYTFLQVKDPITGLWMSDECGGSGMHFISCDGGNVRLANLTGCAIGAMMTNVGSAYTSAPVVTASSGSSTWTAIVGGAINTTVTITTAGVGYNFAPQLVLSAPPAGGVAATATCTISAGAINAVTVVNQGAGYLTAPTVTVVPDPRESSQTSPGPTTTGVLTTALTGSGTITAVLCTSHGTPLTSVPTLTFTGGGGSSAAATVIMCFTATGGTTAGITVSNGGAVYGNAQPFGIMSIGGLTTLNAAIVNPSVMGGLLTVRNAFWAGTSTAGGAVTATGLVATDTGLFQAVPNAVVWASGTSALPTTTAIVTVAVGGVSDSSIVQPF